MKTDKIEHYKNWVKTRSFQLIWRIRFRGCWEIMEVRWLPSWPGLSRQ